MSRLCKGPLFVLLLGVAVVLGLRFLLLGGGSMRLSPTDPTAVAPASPEPTTVPSSVPATPPVAPPVEAPLTTGEMIAAVAPPVAPGPVETPPPPAVAEDPVTDAGPSKPGPVAPVEVARDAVSTTTETIPAPATAEAPARAVVVEPVAVSPPVAPPVVRPKPASPAPAPIARPAPAPTAPPVAESAEADRPPAVASRGKPAAAPAPIAQPVQPNLSVYVEADVDERADLGRYSAAEYAAKLRTELTAVARNQLGADRVAGDGANRNFRARIAEGRPGREELCNAAGAQRLLLADLTVPSAGFSSVPSAYWPEVVFRAINCGDGRERLYPKKRLEPHRLDTFEYQQLFAQRAREFIASQAYFLAP